MVVLVTVLGIPALVGASGGRAASGAPSPQVARPVEPPQQDAFSGTFSGTAGSPAGSPTGEATRGAPGAGTRDAQAPGRAWFDRFPLPPGSQPWSVAVGRDGTVWVVLQGSRQLAALDPATGRWRHAALPRGVRPARVAVSPDGSVWLTDNDFGRDPGRKLWRYRPGAGTWQAYELPFAGAAAVLVDDRGQVWTGQFQGNRLGRLDPRTGRVETWTLPLPEYPWSSIWDLDMDEQGRVWTVSPRTGSVYRLDPRDGSLAEFPLPPDVAGPAGLAVTPAGDGVWVTEHGDRTIGRLDVATGAWVPLLTPPAPAAEEIRATRPNDLEWDRRGHLWVALHTGNALARIDPANATLHLFPLPAGEPKSWVQWLARGPDGALWFAAFGRDYVGRVDPSRLAAPQLSATAERQRLAPGEETRVSLAVVAPPGEEGGGAAAGAATAPEWQVLDLPRGWSADWEERGSSAARARLRVPGDAEPGLYAAVLGVALPDGTVVTRTVRVEVVPGTGGAWAVVAGFAGMVAALTVGWLGVAADLRRRNRPARQR